MRSQFLVLCTPVFGALLQAKQSPTEYTGESDGTKHACYDCAPEGVPKGTIDSNLSAGTRTLVAKARKIGASVDASSGVLTPDELNGAEKFQNLRVHAGQDKDEAATWETSAPSVVPSGPVGGLGNLDNGPGTDAGDAIKTAREAVEEFMTVKRDIFGVNDARNAFNEAGMVFP